MDPATHMEPNIEIVADAEAIAGRMVELFLSRWGEAVKRDGVFRVAVSGGNTPRRFFELLAEVEPAGEPDWSSVHLFWVDERYVEPDSPRSNYKLARDTFLDKVDIPPENVHRIPTEYDDFHEAAVAYENDIREHFAIGRAEIPRFDLVILGMGSDGHTGSLFTGSYAPLNSESLACVVYVLDEKLNRITLTHPVLSAARGIVVLVSGRGKAEIVHDVLASERDEVRYPIQLLWPALDRIIWLVDRDAAGKMKGS